MRKSTENVASKNSTGYERLNEVDAVIIRRQQRAEIKRVAEKGKTTSLGESLTTEFFEGLNIV